MLYLKKQISSDTCSNLITIHHPFLQTPSIKKPTKKRKCLVYPFVLKSPWKSPIEHLKKTVFKEYQLILHNKQNFGCFIILMDEDKCVYETVIIHFQTGESNNISMKQSSLVDLLVNDQVECHIAEPIHISLQNEQPYLLNYHDDIHPIYYNDYEQQEELESLMSSDISLSSFDEDDYEEEEEEEEEKDPNMIQFVQDTLNYIHTYGAFSDELAHLLPKLNDYLLYCT